MGGPINYLADDVPWPPSVEDFYLPAIVNGAYPWFTKFTALVWLAVAIIIVFFLTAYRKPKLVPTKAQWLAESVYGFGRNNVAEEVIGHKGLRFAPYLATLFVFILVTNLFSVVPLIQVSPNAHIAFPAMLAVISYVLFNYLGIRQHGFWAYVKMNLFLPGVPWPMYFLLVPIEFFSTFILRPLTLALRLFANMMAGHLLLILFALGGEYLLLDAAGLVKPVGILAWLLFIAISFLELLVQFLQAYVFVLLNAMYISGALAEEH